MTSDTSKRIAAVDIGSNTLQYVVAEMVGVGDASRLRVIDRKSALVGLGEDVTATGAIGPAKARHAGAVLAEMSKAAEDIEAVKLICLATEALRSADNAEQTLAYFTQEIKSPILLINGSEEAALTFLGATSDMSPSAGRVAVVDLGGGSCEFVVGTMSEPEWLQSIPLGTNRLITSIKPGDPPRDEDYFRLGQEIQSILAQVPQMEVRAEKLIAVGGSATNLARLALRDHAVDTLSPSDLDQIRTLIASKTAETLSSETGVETKRIRLLVAGVLGWAEIMKWANIDSMYVSQAGIREGSIIAWWKYGDNWRAALQPMLERLRSNENAH